MKRIYTTPLTRLHPVRPQSMMCISDASSNAGLHWSDDGIEADDQR